MTSGNLMLHMPMAGYRQDEADWLPKSI